MVVGLSTAFLLDWRVGMVAGVILLALLSIWHYMSLAAVCGLLSCPFVLALVGVQSPWVLVLMGALSLLVLYRHKGNIRRLLTGTESKFSWGSKGRKGEDKEK